RRREALRAGVDREGPAARVSRSGPLTDDPDRGTRPDPARADRARRCRIGPGDVCRGLDPAGTGGSDGRGVPQADRAALPRELAREALRGGNAHLGGAAPFELHQDHGQSADQAAARPHSPGGEAQPALYPPAGDTDRVRSRLPRLRLFLAVLPCPLRQGTDGVSPFLLVTPRPRGRCTHTRVAAQRIVKTPD